MNRGHPDVEPLQEPGPPVHSPVRVDVELGPVQEDQLAFGSQLFHPLALGEHLLIGHALHVQVRRVVGDGVVGVGKAAGCRDHLLERGEAVRQVRMRVKVAPDLLQMEQVRKLAAKSGFDLSAILAKRWRNPRQAQPLVDLLLGFRHDQLSALRLEQAVLRELQALAHGDLPHPDVVGLGAGEVLKGGPPHARGDHPHVDLESLRRPDGRLGVPAGDHSLHAREMDDGFHHGVGLVRGDQDVDVADGLGHPSERACVRALRAAPHGLQLGHEVLCQLRGHAELHPLARLLHHRDPAKDVLFRFWAESLDARQAPLVDGVGQLLNGRDAQVPVEHQRLLRAERGDRDHLPDAGGNPFAQLLQLLEGARLERLANLANDRFPDVGDAQDSLLVQRGEVCVVAADRSRSLLVGPNPEGVAPRDREEVRVLLEQRFHGIVRAWHGPIVVRAGTGRLDAVRPGREARGVAPSAYAIGSRPGPRRRNEVRRSLRR